MPITELFEAIMVLVVWFTSMNTGIVLASTMMSKKSRWIALISSVVVAVTAVIVVLL